MFRKHIAWIKRMAMLDRSLESAETHKGSSTRSHFSGNSTVRRGSLVLLIGMAGLGSATSYADSVKGGPEAGFQIWFTPDLGNNLNRNGQPFWDNQTSYFNGAFGGINFPGHNGNVGYCLTGTGDCVGLLHPGPPPGPIPFWGMRYDPNTDTGGGLDTNVWFKRNTPNSLKATLEIQLSNSSSEINEFGWFETDKDGDVIGERHLLFSGSKEGSTPTPVGTSHSFRPTRYYGYYFKDVSEGDCFVYTLSSFNTGICGADKLPHNLVVFATDPNSRLSSFWIAGEDPAGPEACKDGDCNLTLVKVEPIPTQRCEDDRDRDKDPAKDKDSDEE
jgi:hypothetical protein